MVNSLTTVFLGAAIFFGASAVVTAGDLAGQKEKLPLTPIAYTPDGEPVRAMSDAGAVLVAGAECPTGSGSYCSDELPYCCPGVNVAAYCAKDVNGCTQ